MKSTLPCVAAVLLVTGCTIPKRATSPPPAVQMPTTIDGLVAAIKERSQRIDKETDSGVRAQLADEANGYADACIAQAPQAGECLYGRGVAQGLVAQTHPTKALPLLKSMLQSLSSAEAVDPTYDEVGPARVQALVLARAPGWPVGPGDADEAVVAARRAVALRPSYPPNLLALGEALSKTGDSNGAKDAYTKAYAATQAYPAGVDRDAWLHEAEQGLQQK